MLAVILGTRPEIIKLSPVIRELQRRKLQFFIIHSNQHYSYEMDALFFEQLQLPQPRFNLHANGETQAGQTAKMLDGFEKVLLTEKPRAVVVQGDTNTVLAGALVASKLAIPVAHVEAGLRSFDRRMPEELNRVLTDHLSELLFPPTGDAAQNLENEGIGKREFITAHGNKKQKIMITGNTVVDATMQNIALAKPQKTPEEYVLLTTHRAENVDDKQFLMNLKAALETVDLPVLAPLHPRTRKNLSKFGISLPVTELPPQGYLEFLWLEKNARFIITDSGGVQEEACTLGVPCATVRKTTDRPETISAGANILAGTETKTMTDAFEKALKMARKWRNPYGDGTASQKIVGGLVK